MIIKNREELLSEGNILGRSVVVDILEYAVREVSFDKLVRGFVHVGDLLRIGSQSYDLKEVGAIYVLGAGKQVSYMAAALESILGDRIRDGVVIEKQRWGCSIERIRIVKGGHPLPNEEGVEGAKEIVRIARAVKEDSLVIVCVSGGCTALAELPPAGISLQEVRTVFDLLLRAGAPIEDQNAVRTHLSQLGGGKLSTLLQPAQIVGLIAVDEVSGLLWGPTVPDTATFGDAIKVLKKYDLWGKIPESVRKYFEEARPSEETPKAADFDRLGVRVENFVLADNSMLCEAAEVKGRELNLKAKTIATKLEGEARTVGTVLASIAIEIEKSGSLLQTPCVMIAGGETTVTLTANAGKGGRNQELALSAALKIADSKRIVIASLGTDGSDGPTDIAGAIVDGNTFRRAENAGLDLFENLKRHDSANACIKSGSAIRTNDTETNLMDLIIIYVA